MGTLWTFGCSFTGEYYPVDQHFTVSNYDLYKKWRGGNLPKIWPTLLGEKLNFEIQNKGMGGDSNYGILMKFMDVVDLIKEGDIVVFGWTNVVRFMAANGSINDFNQIVPTHNEYPETGLSKKTISEILVNRSEPIWKSEIINWIKFINLFMEKNKTNVYHWTSDDNLFDADSEFTDLKRFIVVRGLFYNPMILGYLSHEDWYGGKQMAKIVEETNGEVNDCHFGEFGHKTQAEYFYNHIINNLQFDKII